MPKFIKDLAMLVFGLIELLLVFRFVLKLLAANPQAGFVSWIYVTSQPLLHPFLFAFPTPQVRGGFTLEITTLFAIFAYAFMGYLVQELLTMIAKKR
ncbi:MAG: YggT family protein [Candidatus Pacebacteria bacterium]|nr:YggT family protein [Candidatus Paceibacterota bacterium]